MKKGCNGLGGVQVDVVEGSFDGGARHVHEVGQAVCDLAFDEGIGAAHLEVAEEGVRVARLLRVEDCDGRFDSDHVRDFVNFQVLVVAHLNLNVIRDSRQAWGNITLQQELISCPRWGPVYGLKGL